MRSAECAAAIRNERWISPHHQRAGAVVGEELEQHRVRHLAVEDDDAFDETARKLVRMFQENFVKYEQQVDAEVRAAAPEVRIAAE